ncbi:MAG: hypothetical protein ACXVCY_04435 [Pseudobdellovibrionaceae bacterium]
MSRKSDTIIGAADGKSFFRVEKSGKIRFIMMPEDRPVFIGSFNAQKKILFISKRRIDVKDPKYTFAIPAELFHGLSHEVKFVVIHSAELGNGGQIFIAEASRVELFGHTEGLPSMRHDLIQLSPDYWSELSSLEAVLQYVSKSEQNSDEKISSKKASGDERKQISVSTVMEEKWNEKLQEIYKKPLNLLTQEETQMIMKEQMKRAQSVRKLNEKFKKSAVGL